MIRRAVGIAGPLAVMAILLIQGMTAPGYDPIRNTISELGSGWRRTGIIAVYGFVLLTVVRHEVARSLPTTFARSMWVAALMAIGLGCIGLAVFGAESWPWHSMSWRGRLHLIFAFVCVFGGIPAACLAASRALPPAWRGLRAYSLATGLGCLALFAGTLAALGASPPSEFATSHLGIIERMYVFAFMIWQCIVTARLSRSSHKDTR